ncbi:MAG: OmpH family outer membrane protein [Pseudomonadota bacterium]
MRTRRALLKSASCIALMAVGAVVSPRSIHAQDRYGIAMVSRELLLQRVSAARMLRAEEQRMTAYLQAQIDRAKEALADEEADLARLRGELTAAEFAVRIEDFDNRMRLARQLTQERAGELQRAFQEARAEVVAEIPNVIEQLRQDTGASVILNADQVLAADPDMDLTDRAVALYDRIAAVPDTPEIDLTLPVTELVNPAPGADQSDGN